MTYYTIPTWTGREGMDPAFLEMMPDTIVFTPPSAVDKYGKKTFSGTTISIRAHIQNSVEMIKDSEGRDVLAMGKAYLYGVPNITLNYQMTLPDGSNPVIVRFDTVTDTASTAHHSVIYFGK